MESKRVAAEVIGKTTEVRGLIFKKTVYVLAIRMLGINPPTVSREVPFDQYASVNIGQQINFLLFRSKNGWCFSEQEAKLSFQIYSPPSAS